MCNIPSVCFSSALVLCVCGFDGIDGNRLVEGVMGGCVGLTRPIALVLAIATAISLKCVGGTRNTPMHGKEVY